MQKISNFTFMKNVFQNKPINNREKHLKIYDFIISGIQLHISAFIKANISLLT